MSENFKSEESNIPTEKRVENTTEKIEETISGFAEFNPIGEKKLTTLKEKLDKMASPIGELSILDFVKFTGVSVEKIIKELEKPEDEVGWGKFWFNSSKSAIPNSLVIGNFNPIHEKIHELKLKKDGTDFSKNIRKFDIEAMELFKKITLPLEFKNLKKVKIPISDRVYRYLGIDIWISPSLIFRSSFKGQKIVGGVKLYLKSTNPLTSLQMKIVSYLLYLFIKNKIAKEDELVLPEFCLVVDVFNKKYKACPPKSERPISDIKRIHASLISAFNRI